MSEKEKEWTKPMLTVLTRGDGAERVLQHCKGWPDPSGSPEAPYQGCTITMIVCQICWAMSIS